MTEIERQFCEELQELLNRYKNSLSVPRIMHVAQDVFHKTLSVKYHPELHSTTALNYYLQSLVDSAPSLLKKYALHEGSLGRDAVAGITNSTCSSQEIAEADCGGDIRHCKNACGKLRMNKTTISDYQGADRKPEDDCIVRDEEPLEW